MSFKEPDKLKKKKKMAKQVFPNSKITAKAVSEIKLKDK